MPGHPDPEIWGGGGGGGAVKKNIFFLALRVSVWSKISGGGGGGGLILREQLWSFDPCHYSLPLIHIFNKLITNNKTRDDNNNRVKPKVKCETNHIK